jgi:hypothetical protein
MMMRQQYDDWLLCRGLVAQHWQIATLVALLPYTKRNKMVQIPKIFMNMLYHL